MSLLDGYEEITRNSVPLAPFTWLKIGGPAEYLVEPRTTDELLDIVSRCRDRDVPVRVLGGGSRLVVSDAGVPGVVIRLAASAFCEIKIDGQTATAGGGASLSELVTGTVRAGLSGLEHLVGIPGTVGGGLRGNVGSQSGDIGQTTKSVRVVTRRGEVLTREADELHFAYRQSSLDELVILDAAFELEQDDPETLTRQMQKLWILKKSKQPLEEHHTCCVFRDPQGMTAEALIEQAGLKGTRVGNVEISDRHANFIIAHDGASSSDVLRLIELVRTQVADRTGAQLQNDVEIW